MHEIQYNEQWWQIQNIDNLPLHARDENANVSIDSDKEHFVKSLLLDMNGHKMIA